MFRSFERAGAFLGAALMAAAFTAVPSERAAAAKVERVVGDSGVEAYLVRETAVPFVAVSLYFEGGASTDPRGLEGLASMTSALIDEGAGPYDSQAFRQELEDNAIKMRFEADRDGLSGTFKTLNETRDHAFDLLRLALTEPRFDEEPVARIKGQIIADLKRRETSPNYLSGRAFYGAAFGDHVYARPARGEIQTIEAIDKADLEGFVRDRFAKDVLKIGVSGDITADELKALLDKTFGALPDEAAPADLEKTTPAGGGVEVIDFPNPQSVVTFGHAGIDRQDPDYYAAFVANYILGGGGFASRLTEEVREKRGLAYSVYSYLYPTELSPMWMGGVSTNNADVATSIELIRQEVGKMAAGAITEEDLADAKTYLTGSFPLRLTSNDGVAKLLVGMQIAELGLGYIDERNSFIEAVTLDDLKRVAARLFDPDAMIVAVVGQPEGLGADASGAAASGEEAEAAEETAPAAAGG